MHIILTLLRKDFSRLFRDKAGLSLTFIVPFALIYLFGQIFGVNRQDAGPNGIPLAVVIESKSPVAAKLLASLQSEKAFKVLTKYVNADKSTRPLTVEDVRPMMQNNDFRFALVLPRDLVRPGEVGLHLKILSNPRNEIETQTVNGLLQRTIFSSVPKLFGMDEPEPGTAGAAGGEGSGGNFLARLVKIDSEQIVGKQVKAPAATHIVGGWAMQFLLFALSASATALFYEKEQGLFQRILSMPARRSHILWSKFLYGVCLGLVQLVVLFVAGRILYGIDVEHHLGFLLLVCTFAAAACTSFGMLLAAFAPSPEAARGLATLLILLMSAIGGAWFPVSFMPAFIQQISKFTLVYWSMEGFDQVLWAGASFRELLPTLGILGAITAGVMTLAVWRFNRGPLFD